MKLDSNKTNNTTNSDSNIEYDFIDDFFKDEYFKLVELLDYRALTYWGIKHYDHNSLLLDEIESSYEHLKTEEDERDECFENLVEAFESLRILDIKSSDVDELSSKSIDNLLEYNDIIESFRNKFNEIKDELAIKVGELQRIAKISKFSS